MSLGVAVGVATVSLWVALAAFAVGYRPPRPIWPWSFWFAASGLLWSLGEVGSSFLALTPSHHWWFLVVEYTGIVSMAPVFWGLVVALSTRLGTRPRWLTPRLHHGPLLLSAWAWIALVTNPWHGGFLEPVVGARNLYGPVWYFQAAYGYLCMFAAQALIVVSWTRLPKGSPFRVQMGALFFLSFIPHLANFLYVSGLVTTGMDPTVGAFGVSIAIALAGIPRRGLFGMSGLTLEHWLDHEPDGVAIVDAEGRLVRTNPAAASLFGVAELALGTDLLAFLGERVGLPEEEEPIGKERLSAHIAGALSEDTPLLEASSLFRLTGEPAGFVRMRTTRIPARWPSRSGMAFSFRDESRLEATSERASRQAASIDAILGSIEDGLFVADEEGRIVYANERLWALWELPAVLSTRTTESELLDKLWGRVEPGGATSPLTSRSLGQESDVRLRSGRILSYAVMPLRRGRKERGRVWTFRDQTDRRRAEEELRQAEERKGTSHKLESLGMLAAAIAHDFNNILQGIMGNIELATQALSASGDGAASAERLPEHLERARRSADRAADLVQQLLSYAGRGDVSIEEVDLSSLVDDTLELLRAVISKKARLRVALEPSAIVRGDAVQLRQIVMNLVTNASEALEANEGIIEVRTTVSDVSAEELSQALPQREGTRPGRYVALTVSDSGCGMTPSQLQRIFEPFYTTKLRGRGLGLASVLGIVRRHGGLVKVRSRRGEGSSFVLWFPAMAPATASARQLSPDGVGRTAGVELSTVASGTVLVVDDEAAVRDVAEEALARSGFAVLVAADGQEGLDLYRAHAEAIDAVLLDLTMPRMDGAETLFAIRQSSRTVPVILTSGYSEAESMRRTHGLPHVSFLQKPYTANVLVATIRAAVGNGKAKRIEPVAEEG